MMKSILVFLVFVAITASAVPFAPISYVDRATNGLPEAIAAKQDKLPWFTNNIPKEVLGLATWAKAANPPESMPSTGLVYNALAAEGQKVYTKDGVTTITAAMVGALPAGTPIPVLPTAWALSAVTNSAGGAVAAADVGALSLASGGTVSNNIELCNGTDQAYSPRIQFSALWNGDKLTRSIYANDIGMYLDGVYSMSMNNSMDWSGITRYDGTSLQNDLDEKANGYTVNNLSATLSSATSTLSTVSSTVSQWSTYWDGDDVRVTITNYYGSSSLPSMYLEQKVADGGTNYFRTVWNELTRWNQFIGPGWDWMSSSWIGFNAWRTNITAQLDQKADRAWGYYDSHAGGYAPDGYTWISSPRIAISGGMAYQRFGDSAHAVWVLESNGLVTETSGVATNGYFKISDDEGNEMFAIRKGDKRTVGATCGSITTTVGAGGITHVHCTYAVVSGDRPTISTTADLANPNWKDETAADSIANVTWTGSSGNWHAEVWGKTDLSSMFIRATYEVGGETMIENAAPVKMNYIYLGGTKYSLGTASISGHTVLTLTPAP